MRRAAAIALAALAAAPGAARAQFRARPMVIPVPSSGTAVLAQPFVTPRPLGEPDLADLLLARSGAAASLRPHQALLSPLALSPVAQPTSFRCVAAGLLAQNGGDALPDVVYCAGLLNELQIAFGDAPGQVPLPSYTHALNTPQTPTLTFARLHPPPRAQVLVLPVGTGGGETGVGELYALDFGTAAGAPPMTDASWDAGEISTRVLPDEVLTMRISPTARALGIDDLYIPGFGSVTLYAHAQPPTGSTLADVRFGAKVKVGGAVEEGLDPSLWLPPDVKNAEVLGAAALDVDLDGDLDLVVALAPSVPTGERALGRLLWVERTGDVASLAASRPWRDLTVHPDLQPLVDPGFLRALELDGAPAFAVHDRGTGTVLVVTADASGGRLRAWRGSAAGRELRDFRLADVAGSPAPDLVANGVPPAPGSAVTAAVLVWPDLADASPEIAWAPGNPGAPIRGEDLPLAVSARDPDGPFAVDWMVGDAYGPPSGSAAGAAGGAFAELAWVLGGDALCGAPPQTLAVTVRATDALGVFDEVAASLAVAFGAPALALAGAVPAGRLVLPPGGTVATLEASAWTRCGPVAFTWGGSVFDAGATVTADDGANTTRRILDLTEATYPALLAGAPGATLVVTDPASGLESPPALLDLDLDARGLVEVEHAADAVALEPGEVGVVRTRLRSRIGVPLPNVRVVDVLAGLAPAGPPRVVGAGVVGTAAGGAEIVLDALPAAGVEVEIELPVRSSGERGSSAVEARSSGGHLLTDAAVPGTSGAPAPGCGCGGGGTGLEALLAVVALAARRRRVGARRAGGAPARASPWKPPGRVALQRRGRFA